MVVQIFVRGKHITIDLCDTEEQLQNITALQLKEKIIETFLSGLPVEKLRLVFKGRELKGDRQLSDYRIQHESTIDVLLAVKGGGEDPWKGDGGMGDKEGKNRSMEKLSLF